MKIIKYKSRIKEYKSFEKRIEVEGFFFLFFFNENKQFKGVIHSREGKMNQNLG